MTSGRMREIAPPCGGLGALLALFVLFVHRSGACTIAAGISGWKSFAAGAFAGLAFCAVALGLFYAKDRFADCRPARRDCPRPARRRAAAPSRFAHSAVTRSAVARSTAGALLVAGGLAAFYASGTACSVAGLDWAVGGMESGVGLALLALPYGRLYAGVPVCRALGMLGGSLLVAFALDALVLALPDGAIPYAACAEAIAAAVLPLVAVAEKAACLPGAGDSASASSAAPDPHAPDAARIPAGPSRGPFPDEPFSRRVVRFAVDVWRPFVGAVICLFVFGFTWDTDALGVQLNASAPMAAERLVGFGIAGAFLIALARYRGARDVRAVLLNTVLPVMVVTFVLRPYFLNAELGTGALMVIGVARETGFVLFLASAWLAAVEGAKAWDIACEFAVALLVGVCSLSGLLGLYWLHLLGPMVNYAGAVLFVVYLVVTLVVMATSGQKASQVHDDQLKEREQQGFEHFLESRCARISEEYGLTSRERDIVLLLGRGHSYAYVAGELGVSENTVRTHVRNMYRKLGIQSREELLEVVHGGK